MKKLIAFLIASIFMVSCGSTSYLEAATERPRSVPDAITAPLNTPTPSLIPTPTIGWEGTAIAAQAAYDDAMRQMVQATNAEAERVQERLAWTHQADVLTQQAESATAAAFPTYYPATQTAQVKKDLFALQQENNDRAQLEATLRAPTMIIAMANAKTIAEYSDEMQWATIFAIASLGVLSISLALLILFRAFSETKQSQPVIVDLNEQDNKDIPLAKINDNVMLRAEIPCNTDQLIEFAEGVINRNMPFSFGAWEGTEVHKRLKEIREFFKDHKLAKYIKGSNGMMDPLAEGEAFLRYVIEHGEPPKPYKCIG